MCACIFLVFFLVLFGMIFGNCSCGDSAKEEFKGDFNESLAERVRALLRNESPNWKYHETIFGNEVRFKKKGALSCWPRLSVVPSRAVGLDIVIDDGSEYGESILATTNDEECMKLYRGFCQHGKAVDENEILNKL